METPTPKRCQVVAFIDGYHVWLQTASSIYRRENLTSVRVQAMLMAEEAMEGLTHFHCPLPLLDVPTHREIQFLFRQEATQLQYLPL